MIYIGIDVDKQKLKCQLIQADSKARPKAVNNNAAGIDALMAFALRVGGSAANELAFVMEATGVYYELAAHTLHDAGATVYVVNPARAKHFKSAEGIQTKTDEVDALVLARFGQCCDLQPFTPEPLAVRELKQLLARLAAVKKDQQREKNRLEKTEVAAAPQAVLDSLNQTLAFLKEQEEALQEQIDDHLDQNPDLRGKQQLIASIPGVGDNTANQLTALLCARPFENAKAVASFVGLSVRHNQSGLQQGRSVVSKDGNPKLRAALFMPALMAIRWNPVLKAFYERLLANGKSKMVAVTAVMRKLIHMAYGIFKSGKPFNANHALQM